MGDFIKELTVIDFLGILFPGAALLLLINYSETGQMTGLQFTAADTVLLLAGGYLLGSLVHEVGDMLEKFLWQFPGFDPKVYAARRVGLDTAQGKSPLKEVVKENAADPYSGSLKNHYMKPGWSLVHGAVLGFLLYLMLPISVKNGELCFAIRWGCGLCWGAVGGAGAALAASVLNECARAAEKQDARHQEDKPPEPKRDKKDSAAWSLLFSDSWIQAVNPMIQTKIVNRENYNKRVLFDGFHAMMRNLCLIAALLNLYSKGAGIDPALVTFIGSYTKLPERSCTVAATVLILLMMVRYAHYSYLKYKYSYENFINWCEEQKKGSAAPNNSQSSKEWSGASI